MDIFVKLFSGIGTFFIEDPKIAIARFLLIVLGFILAWMGFRRKLEPLIMVPMGLGMIAVNAGVLFLAGGQTGTLILDPMVSEPKEGANKQVISSQADSLIKISRIWADFFPANNRISLFRLFFPPFLALFPVFTEISPTDVSFGPPETGWPG